MITFHSENHDLRNPYTLIATFFGCGFLRPAPGTWGSIVAIPICYSVFFILGFMLSLIAYVFLFIIGTYAAHKFDQDAETHDHKSIVIDELAGQWITLIPVFYVYPSNAFLLTVMAFLFFRFFDIIKPWPICLVDQKIPGAWGVMLDDVVAGLFSALLLTGLILWML